LADLTLIVVFGPFMLLSVAGLAFLVLAFGLASVGWASVGLRRAREKGGASL
jgi:hypothetical protein